MNRFLSGAKVLVGMGNWGWAESGSVGCFLTNSRGKKEGGVGLERTRSNTKIEGCIRDSLEFLKGLCFVKNDFSFEVRHHMRNCGYVCLRIIFR